MKSKILVVLAIGMMLGSAFVSYASAEGTDVWKAGITDPEGDATVGNAMDVPGGPSRNHLDIVRIDYAEDANGNIVMQMTLKNLPDESNPEPVIAPTVVGPVCCQYEIVFKMSEVCYFVATTCSFTPVSTTSQDDDPVGWVYWDSNVEGAKIVKSAVAVDADKNTISFTIGPKVDGPYGDALELPITGTKIEICAFTKEIACVPDPIGLIPGAPETQDGTDTFVTVYGSETKTSQETTNPVIENNAQSNGTSSNNSQPENPSNNPSAPADNGNGNSPSATNNNPDNAKSTTETKKTPGFELLGIVAGISVILAVRRRR
ncbi:MAG: hypothetical protein PHH26_07775 [Candidatus Thermoplasmatota archaeon]|nr:hypothetical protein [Candidatus Thermoplasmatota archaeon]